MEELRFSPEQQKAFEIFLERLPRWREHLILSPDLSFENICITNTIFFTDVILDTTTLPRQTCWLWNKSKPSQPINIGNNIVSFYKLNTRKTRKSPVDPPLYKVWIFDIINDSNQLSYFWCERGIEEIPIEPVNLNDLSFLSAFTTQETALTLGWV